MKKLLWLLPLLAGCGQNTAEHPAAKQPAPQAQKEAQGPVVPAEPATAYTSGDRDTNGPLDTLHVGRGLVLRLVPGSKKDFARAPHMAAYQEESAYLLNEPAGRVQRNDKILALTLANGKKRELVDDTSEIRGDEDEATGHRYEFHGTLKQLPYWQVDSLLYEGGTTLLINKITGSSRQLWNYPVLSTDSRMIAVHSQGLETAMAPSGLQLLAVSERRITLLWSRVLQHWEPYRIHWLDNRTLAIEQRRFPATPEEKFSYVRLILPH